MKYKVLQIPFPTNEVEEKIFHKYAYAPLRWIDRVHPEYYKVTYDGNIETTKTDVFEILEELFTLLNINHPEDYKGHSLSVSDIILIDEHYYFCDSLGWKEVEYTIL